MSSFKNVTVSCLLQANAWIRDEEVPAAQYDVTAESMANEILVIKTHVTGAKLLLKELKSN